MNLLKQPTNISKQTSQYNSGQKTQAFFTSTSHIILIALLCTFLWGSAYPFIKIGYKLFAIDTSYVGNTILFAGYRFFLAGIFTLLFSFFSQKKICLPKRSNLKRIAILGFVQTFLHYIFFYIGLSHTSGSKGSIIYAANTFITIIIAHFIYKNDKLTISKSFGCFIGFFGIILVNLNGGFHQPFTFLGEGFMLFSAITYSIGSLISKSVSIEEHPLISTGYQLFFGGLLLILFGICSGGKITTFTLQGGILFLYLSALSSIAFTLWLFLLRYNSVGKITIFNSLIPVFGTLLSGLFIGENIFRFSCLFSLLCVSLGIYFVNYNPKCQKKI